MPELVKTSQKKDLQSNLRGAVMRPRAGMALFRAIMHSPMEHLDEAFIENMVAAIDIGNFPETAAASLGIPPALWQKWYDAGMQICVLIQDDPTNLHMMSDDEEKLLLLFQAVSQALSDYELKAVGRIEEAARYDWAAGAFLLAKRFPERWGKQRESGAGVTSNNNVNQGVLAVSPQEPQSQWLENFQDAKIADGGAK